MRTQALIVAAILHCVVLHAAPVVNIHAQPAYRSPEEVVIDVFILNPEVGCKPLIIDTTISPAINDARPSTVVSFEVTDLSSGERIRRIPSTPDFPAPRASDFLYLDCGRGYGGSFSLAAPGWRVPLRAGRYSARAVVSSTARRYLTTHPELGKTLARSQGINQPQLMKLIPPEGGWSSAEVTFTVESP